MIFSPTMEPGQLVMSPPYQDQQNMELLLPPGFRFHPTDEELVTHYLCRKVSDATFCPRAIAEVDLNKCEPWDLPWKATMGEKEWYFFCVRDRKYPTGLRTNRATESGYWKATGKDREVRREGSALVGMKKTLVFYRGRAPKGEKTGWVMHEYRLEGKNHPSPSFLYNPSSSKSAKNDWVLCRVFEKDPEGKKSQSSESPGPWSGTCSAANFNNTLLPPLLPDSPYDAAPVTTTAQHVPCFSSANGDGYLGAALLPAGSAGRPCSLNDGFGGTGGSQRLFPMLGSGMMTKVGGEIMEPSAGMVQPNSGFSSLLTGNSLQRRWFGGGELADHSAGALAGVDEDCFWNY